MIDAEFARAFERGEVPPSEFSHLAHVRLAWVYLHEAPTFAAALTHIRDGIQRFAASAGAARKYHETITVLWMRLLIGARARVPVGCTFQDLLDHCPELGDKDLPLRYYSRERLFSDAARAGWVAPDLVDIAACGA
jgi:hypothetical protein